VAASHQKARNVTAAATLSERTELTAPALPEAIMRLNSTTGMLASAQRCARAEDRVVAPNTMPSTLYCRISSTKSSELALSPMKISRW
jgi:hypothetical protein